MGALIFTRHSTPLPGVNGLILLTTRHTALVGLFMVRFLTVQLLRPSLVTLPTRPICKLLQTLFRPTLNSTRPPPTALLRSPSSPTLAMYSPSYSAASLMSPPAHLHGEGPLMYLLNVTVTADVRPDRTSTSLLGFTKTPWLLTREPKQMFLLPTPSNPVRENIRNLLSLARTGLPYSANPRSLFTRPIPLLFG